MPTIQVGGHRGGQRKVQPVVADIDEEDMERVSQYKWSICKQGNTTYSKTHKGGNVMWLHRFIMGLGDYKDDKRIVDHKDGNGLNNKKENLVICDTLYNSQSFRRHHNSNVGWVYQRKDKGRRKKFLAIVVINKVRNEKHFLTEQEGKDWITSLVQQSIHLGD